MLAPGLFQLFPIRRAMLRLGMSQKRAFEFSLLSSET